MKTTASIIREFFGLPAEAMPSATYADDMPGSAWAQIRDYCRADARQRMNHCGEMVVLTADRDGWREGVTVILD